MADDVPLKQRWSTWLTETTVPKNRRPKFELLLRILDLNNVPYVSGRSFVKWALPHSNTDEHRGHTEKLPIKDHKVHYNYETRIPLRILIDKTGALSELPLQLDVLHEVSTVGKSERIVLGNVKLNLAEYVEASEQSVEEDGVTRRYLMQNSKINSTLKIGIFLKQLDGDRNYTTPPLRVAPVFSGIAGIVVGEPEDGDEQSGGSRMPAAVSSQGQVAGDELKELYRRTIAAEWTCLPGGLAADKVVEDIFHGGDGWGGAPESNSGKSSGKEGGGTFSDDDAIGKHGNGHEYGRGLRHSHERKTSKPFWYRSRQDTKRSSKERLDNKSNVEEDGLQRSMGIRGRASFEQQATDMGRAAEAGRERIQQGEVDEMAVRDDLRSWLFPPG